MAEIKTEKNASKALDQDPTNGVLRVTSKACDMAKSRASVSNTTVTT